MMRILFAIVLLFTLLPAQSINKLIKDTLGKHPSLRAIEHKLSLMDEKINKSQIWQNPDLTVTLNDIQFQKPLNRSLEPMQYQSLTFRQKLPWFGKLDAKKSFYQEKKRVILHTLEGAKVALAKEIRNSAYTIKELELRIAILRRYMGLAQQNIDLYTNYISTQPMSHAQSVSAELALSNIKMRYERYRSQLLTQKEILGYLSGVKITKISDGLRIKKPRSLQYYLQRAKNNPGLKMKQASVDTAKVKEHISELEKHPDPFVQISYANREDFPDYISVTVGVSLPIYGREDLESEIARKEKLSTLSEMLDYKALLESQIRQEYTRLKEAYRIHGIITNRSLPQLEHMLELSSTAIEEGADLLTYTKILEEKLALEEERVRVKAVFMRTLSNLKALIGEKQ